MDALIDQLKNFSNFKNCNNSFYEITEVAPYILRFTPKELQPQQKSMGFLGLTHGNEHIGLPILISIAESLVSGTLQLNNEVYFGLGNVPAALENKRFLQVDLNRSFGQTSIDSTEAQRARELEAYMLNHCDYIIDIHQTVHASETPFFIFQYSDENCLNIINQWNPSTSSNKGIPVVLQEDPIGINTGLSTDEYLRKIGKFGAALELGQLGTDTHHELGVNICMNALQSINKAIEPSQEFHFPVMWLNGIYRANDSSSHLDKGWYNLKPFTKGQRLGQDSSGDIVAPTDGCIIFPRYRKLQCGEEVFFYCTPFEGCQIKATAKVSEIPVLL